MPNRCHRQPSKFAQTQFKISLNHCDSLVRFSFSLSDVLAVCQNQILQITEACGVLIRYILNKFEKSTNSETKLLLPALKSLCEGKSQDQDFDQIVLSSILRNAKYPEHKTNVTGGTEKDSPKSEMKRSRSDLLTVILQQLSTSIGGSTPTTWNPLSEDVADCTVSVDQIKFFFFVSTESMN